jgi:hypothetical protein
VFLCLWFVCVHSVWPRESLLVVVDELDIRQSHSRFFDGLEDHNFELVFRAASDPTLVSLKPFFVAVLFFSMSEQSTFRWRSVLRWALSQNGGLLVAGPSLFSRQLAARLGVRFTNNLLVDYIHHHSLGNNVVEGKTLAPSFPLDPTLYSGPALELGSQVASCTLSGKITSFANRNSTDVCFLATLQLSSLRVAFLGSPDFISNSKTSLLAPSTGKVCGNLVALTQMTGWLAGRLNVLRVRTLSVANLRDTHSLFVTVVIEGRSERAGWHIENTPHIANATLMLRGKEIQRYLLVADGAGRYVQQFSNVDSGDYVVVVSTSNGGPTLHASKFVRVAPKIDGWIHLIAVQLWVRLCGFLGIELCDKVKLSLSL